MLNVWDRMIEIQFSNKTRKDVALAQRINKLIAAIERLQGVPAQHADSMMQLPEFADLAKYKVFGNIIAITNETREEVSSSADFSKASIDRRIAAGYAASGWYGICAPAGTPEDIIEKLNTAITACVADPTLKQRLLNLGVEPMPMPVASFRKFVAEEIAKYAKVIQFAGIKVD
jgi:Tripartite tricarboxylate transporter family receptor/Patatin phospholipase